MAAMEVLRPNDLLPTTSSCRRRTFLEAPKKKEHGKSYPKHNRSRSAAVEKKSNHREVTDRRRKVENTKSSGGGLVMGKVTLLRRGESLSSLALESPKSLEEIVPKKKKLHVAVPAPVPALPTPAVEIYAGTAFIESPSPRSVPKPTFLKEDANSFDDGATRFSDDSNSFSDGSNSFSDDSNSVEDGATMFLRRVLRLE